MEKDLQTINDWTRQILREYGVKQVSKLATELARLNKNATGKLSESLNSEVVDFITNINLQFEAAPQVEFVVRGRLPGHFAPVQKIKDWCKVRNIDEALAYPINHKIYKFGIKPTPFIDNVFSQDESFDDLTKELEDNYEGKIESYLENIFKLQNEN